MRQAVLCVVVLLALVAMSCPVFAAAEEVTAPDTSQSPNTKYWFPHYLLAPGDVGWSEYNYGESFTIDYPPGQPTFTVQSNMMIVSGGIVRSGSKTWMGDIFLAVETSETVKYYFQWWPYVNMPGKGSANVPYVVKWVGDPWDPYGYWQRLYRLDP